VRATRAAIAMALLSGSGYLTPRAVVHAQAGAAPTSAAQREGTLPDASFDATFRKYTRPANIFSPFYSWDAHMTLNLTVVRKGASAMTWGAVFQTVGTENLGSKVSVGGTGYLLSLGYVRTYSDQFNVSAGITHLSTHLTRDLDDKLEEERSAGAAIPIVEDPSEYNVVFFKAHLKLAAYPFTPELEAVIQPINFRFSGSTPVGEVRPVYLATRSTLWRRSPAAMVLDTQHEIGRNAFNNFSLALELDPGGQQSRRVQLFISASPGDNLHVSPAIGGIRDGIAFGIRMKFRA
jgi:hypothetical protein